METGVVNIVQVSKTLFTPSSMRNVVMAPRFPYTKYFEGGIRRHGHYKIVNHNCVCIGYLFLCNN